jgi:hypothetical protein
LGSSVFILCFSLDVTSQSPVVTWEEDVPYCQTLCFFAWLYYLNTTWVISEYFIHLSLWVCFCVPQLRCLCQTQRS